MSGWSRPTGGTLGGSVTSTAFAARRISGVTNIGDAPNTSAAVRV